MKAEKLPFVNFVVAREYRGRNGLWNPRDGAAPIKGGLQINVFGRREHYLQLADFLQRFAERDTSIDSDYHDHFEGFTSADGNLRLHVILRKDDVGDSTWKRFFPKPALKRLRKRKRSGA